MTFFALYLYKIKKKKPQKWTLQTIKNSVRVQENFWRSQFKVRKLNAVRERR